METLANRIKDLKAGRTLAQIKKEDIKLYYKIQDLSSKLSEQKAYNKGQFITKAHLTEYKGLIIWLLKNKCNYKGYLNLKQAMTALLEMVEIEKIVYKTERGIKGIISTLTVKVGLSTVNDILREVNGIEPHANTYGNTILENFESFRINALM